ncbi:hypothetical protein INQ93_01325 [Chlamydia suis]|uniref:Uncharacterized protein n=1 Tax=Chlamydia suis TaxID=83559 RepID=A0AAQ0J6H7_9CHLA|nr:hypothetical protein [Chlamydia suis]MEB2681477.1 hypothetical protein [Chlamydia suis]MEB2681653.1 hypothetical protein [Chlamydia suis]MEB2682574.1 hypothetical protein [Chlamydia suis]MEB2684185.1 hypothetical protein [Chlamydia suis]MEB2684389.1 hypothetical protein [Chlamydia suis]
MDAQFIADQVIRNQGAASVSKKIQEDVTSPSNKTFEGPVRSLDQLRQALIAKMGEQKGLEMYDRFIQSLLISTFTTVHKEMDRAQRASKKMRSVYKD